ncbi:glycosyltransferase [Sphingobacterium multivorum]|uniref:Glycosyltransferase n=1 Tax=Sphingobacterium multivorum TaxID=28454 RepID=A0ABX7CPE1_SPHMU|nr:glycosyltransferase [Sphingobacterium multivorum]QQT53185.1 glycosyltransferase [Sphingobacterium multivorum]
MSKRVLILVPNDTLGGAEQHLKNIAIYMLGAGYSLDVFFLKKEITGAWRDLKGNVNFYFTNKEKEISGAFSCLGKLINNCNERYEYIFTSHVHLNSLAGLLIRCGLIKTRFFVGRESTSIFKRYQGRKLLFFKVLYKIGYSKLDLLICQTSYMREQLIMGLPNLASKINIQVIPNPINLKNIVLTDIEQRFQYSDFIVSAGRLIPEKGFDVLINAFAILKRKFPQLKLLILGDGGERDKLNSLIEEFGLLEDVYLLGFKKNVYPYFLAAKSCVVSSRIEGFPNVLLQMMSQNDNVVSTLCAGGIADIPSIYTCEPNDVDELAVQIENSLINDNSFNREVFDDFLDKRSVPKFVEQINRFLNV